MGLAIVFNIIQKHNGEISVESEEGKGTMFTITLPGIQADHRRNKYSAAMNEHVASGFRSDEKIKIATNK